MDDTCAVCADTLEWVAFGACAHKDVCSTCVARLRFICDDRRCCICKTDSPFVFVTKALGDYTNTIRDFSVLPSEPKEGRAGQYWYHEDTQAFFDDLDHYKMIKAMCKLSCSVCDKMDALPDDTSRRRTKFKNIEQLKGHLFHKHRLLMCSLCLEGRKVFICEQKLYTRSQLTQHINSGDSEVDGTESERGGFTGHPNCEFCRTPFYGDNELYMHMSTEHYTCHICQRLHQGQYEYYKNYDDLEMHFRRDHLLCEDEGCLAKKFIVFQSEAELKRHNALEHGGRMSRSKRNAVLQIPTSFRYRRNSEQGTRRGRARTFLRDPVDSELSLAIQASLDAVDAAPSTSQVITDHLDVDGEPRIPPLDSLSTTDSEPPSRYLQALSISSRNGALGESSFPPLAAAAGSNQSNSNYDALPKETMAAHLQRKNKGKKNLTSSSPAWSAGSHAPARPLINPDSWPSVNTVSGLKSTSGQSRLASETGPASSSNQASTQGRPPVVGNSSFAASLVSSRASGSTSRISHSSSAPNLSIRESLESSSADFPPVSTLQSRNLLSSDFPPVSAAQMHKSKNSNLSSVSALQTHKSPNADLGPGNAADVHQANKSLVEKMRAALGFDEDKFSAFKEISAEYRQGSMDAMTYMSYVDQFGLSHLVHEMARLLPNAQKQKELVEAYSVYTTHTSIENGESNEIQDGNTSRKGKGKSKGKGKLEAINTESGTVKNNIAENVMNTVRELQSNYRASGEDVEVLSKDGYRAGKPKHVDNDLRSKLNEPGEYMKQKSHIESSSTGDEGSQQSSSRGEVKSKQKKKTSKFHRVRLGGDSVEAIYDGKKTDADPDPGPDDRGTSSSDGSFPARGVWRNGGGQKLLAISSRGPKK